MPEQRELKKIIYRCPSCNQQSLFIDSRGGVTCGVIGCQDPCALNDIIESPPTEPNKDHTQEQCPVCGYYCLGKGGHGCIDKPSLCGLGSINTDWVEGVVDEEKIMQMIIDIVWETTDGGCKLTKHSFVYFDEYIRSLNQLLDYFRKTLTQKNLKDDEIIQIALESGFMLSTQYGQKEPKLMPISDKDTLIKFAKTLTQVKKG